ncbi:hypothetical protein [Homoserinibacter sp. YIM 151385]|uniref:hypothetical protein n=1 Tax=Homoserinibacter sp. YIM 151385 TaxID=2985506 RepID=UPI0022EFF30D|nr:hypothetical protein [Homoserinibacter sp. YIM 151385]WBU36706.1 hypothetical protein OF852_07080 [Homoserinibacter sp. YIM 151385]
MSKLSEGDSRESQNTRAVKWLLEQPGGPVTVVTPRKDIPSPVIEALVGRAGVSHHSWKGFSAGSFRGERVLYAWPDREHLNDVWQSEADAVAVIEWSERETAEWIEDVSPFQLLSGTTVPPTKKERKPLEPLPNGVDAILEHIAAWAAGYDSGLKWNEEDKLKADMMNRPARWAAITVEQVRAKCRALGIRPADVDTIAGYLQRRKDGRRFIVRSSYRTFTFD